MTHIIPVDVEVTQNFTEDVTSGYWSVMPVWPGVDRPRVDGYLIKTERLAGRLARAMLAGVVYVDTEVTTDVDGETYVTSRSTVLARMANADLRRLGY